MQSSNREILTGTARLQRVDAMIADGASVNDLAREFDISPQAMSRYLKRYNTRTKFQQRMIDND